MSKASELVNMLARYGNSYDHPYGEPINVREYCRRRNIEYEMVIEVARIYGKPIPLFENLIGSTWTSSGVKISKSYPNGSKETIIDGDGQYSTNDYWAFFEIALTNLNRALEDGAYHDLLVSIERGVSSIEAYIAHRVHLWNTSHPTNLLIDSARHKVSFDRKIDEWIPVMTGGIKLDKSRKSWNDFTQLKMIRDDFAVHPKRSATGMTFREFERVANLFRSGIAALLVELHLIFRERIPAAILKEMYSPPIMQCRT